MPNGFCKSEEGIKAYAEIGKAYDSSLSDEHHERFIQQTKRSQYSAKAKTEVIKIVRVIADDGNEYLVYDELNRGYDNLGNPMHSYRPELGKYPIPIPRKELRMGPDMTQQEVVAEIVSVDTGYSIPFSEANIEKLHKNANDAKQRGATQYQVQRSTRPGIVVKNYDAMREGEFIQLEKYGMTLQQWTEHQKALQDLHKVAQEAKSPEEQEKAVEALAEAGERVSGPTETSVERAKRKEEEGISKEPEEEKASRGRPSQRR
jgi:hypothetical protein